jgi:hypothetical protein
MSTSGILLTREQFKANVFARDKGKCVLCGAEAVDAHHILDRKLFSDGGYFIDNGASVCADDHMRCETTEVSVEEVRKAAGIKTIVLPESDMFDETFIYDKWGNVLLPDGQKMQGPLFADTAVQTLLRDQLYLFIRPRIKYPRTYHLDYSLSLMNDDRRLETTKDLEGYRVVLSEKYDGESCSVYSDYIHARSPDGRHHGSRDYSKMFWGQIKHQIPEDWRISFENTYATHSIKYRRELGNALPHFMIGLSIWDRTTNTALPWDDTLTVFEELGITPPKILYDGIYDDDLFRKIAKEQNPDLVEGFVIRRADAIRYDDFHTYVAKYVRAKHVATSQHWMTAEIVPNEVM